MSVHLRNSTYAEEFRCPPRGKPALARPSSAHRRNNPHPRPDFLLPRRLQTGYGARLMAPARTAPDCGSRFFPPLRHVSFPCQEGKPPSLFLNPDSTDRPATHKPAPSLPHSCSKMETQKSCMQSNGHLKGPQCFHSDIQPHISERHRGILGSRILKEPISKRPDNTTFSRNPKLQMCFKKSRSNLDPSAVYSCFQVVKPYKAGYYIIHPEFMSESLK